MEIWHFLDIFIGDDFDNTAVEVRRKNEMDFVGFRQSENMRDWINTFFK